MLSSQSRPPVTSKNALFASRTAKMVLGDKQAHQTRHRHKPIELIVALDGPIDMVDGEGHCLSGTSFLVPPMCAHGLRDYRGRLARIYLDVGYRRMSVWTGRGIGAELGDDRALRGEIERFLRSDRSPQAAADLMDLWLNSWLDDSQVGPAFDRRVATVLAYLESRDVPIEADRQSVSELVGLSPTRFAALFVENTGMPLSRYLIWRRVKIGLAFLCAGNSVTDAAAYAGFSDNAHFTRSCRTTYGYAPSHAMGMTVTEVKHIAFGQEVSAGRHICLSPPGVPSNLRATSKRRLSTDQRPHS